MPAAVGPGAADLDPPATDLDPATADLGSSSAGLDAGAAGLGPQAAGLVWPSVVMAGSVRAARIKGRWDDPGIHVVSTPPVQEAAAQGPAWSVMVEAWG